MSGAALLQVGSSSIPEVLPWSTPAFVAHSYCPGLLLGICSLKSGSEGLSLPLLLQRKLTPPSEVDLGLLLIDIVPHFSGHSYDNKMSLSPSGPWSLNLPLDILRFLPSPI